MPRKFTFGSNVRIGFAYDEQFHFFSEFEAKLGKVTAFDFKHADVNSVEKLSSSQMLPFLTGGLLDDSVLKIVDFSIVNDDRKYYKFIIYVLTRKEGCELLQEYSTRYKYRVCGVEYGLFMQIIIPEDAFPATTEEMTALLKATLADVNKLSDIQKQTKCRVLVNAEEERETTLEEVFRIKDDFKTGQHSDAECVVVVEIKENTNLPLLEFKNEVEFRQFLTYLFACYRKIEVKLENVEYPNLIDAPKCEDSMIEMCVGLFQAKNKLKSMPHNDFFKLYPVIKKLFWKYNHYLKFAIANRLNIDEGEHLPLSVAQLQTWLKKLNDWMPVKLGNLWYGVGQSYLVCPNGFVDVEKKVSSLLKNIVVRKDNSLPEPHLLFIPNSDNVLGDMFGFVDMSGAQKRVHGNLVMLKIKCPKECTLDPRKWICDKCGELVKLSQVYMFCKCGGKEYARNLLVCNQSTHKKK